jgi:nitrate/TMAO reductase-like tetraheme cytochrome c subunit
MTSSWMKSRRLVLPVLMMAGAGLVTLAAQAEERRVTINNRLLQQECGSCHVVYPPQLLPAASWRAVMGGLDKHFGTDASLDAAARSEILRYLQANADRHDTPAGGEPLLRISETRWFVNEHSEELPRDIWRNPAAKSPANCSACHTAAEQGDYSERWLRIPRGVSK